MLDAAKSVHRQDMLLLCFITLDGQGRIEKINQESQLEPKLIAKLC